MGGGRVSDARSRARSVELEAQSRNGPSSVRIGRNRGERPPWDWQGQRTPLNRFNR